MTQLTKEHFDKFAQGTDRRFESVEGKLAEQTRQLKAHTDTQVENLRQEMQEGFAGVEQKLDALRELLDVRQRVEHIEQQMRQLQTQK